MSGPMLRLTRRGALAGLTVAFAGEVAFARTPAAAAASAFLTRRMTAEGRIVDDGSGGVSHTEGQGYGLLLAVAANDRGAFERMWRWTAATLSRPDTALFRWRYDPRATPAVADPNNATDGDLLIAWALARAARRWRSPDYDQAAQRILAAVAASLVVDTPLGSALLPGLEGFRTADAVTLNPSYWVWPALAEFAARDPGGPWAVVMRAGERLLEAAAFGPSHLPCDWVDVAAGGAADGVATPAAGRPARFGYDALRIPLYLAWAGRSARLQSYRAFWSADLAAGRRPPAWIDVTTGERAPYPVSAGAAALCAWIAGVPAPPAADETTDYYSDVLSALLALAKAESGAVLLS
jgi:endoglucanase